VADHTLELVARHDERIRDLEEWRVRQNGELKAIRERLDNEKNWLMGLLGSMVLALLLLVVNLWLKTL